MFITPRYTLILLLLSFSFLQESCVSKKNKENTKEVREKESVITSQETEEINTLDGVVKDEDVKKNPKHYSPESKISEETMKKELDNDFIYSYMGLDRRNYYKLNTRFIFIKSNSNTLEWSKDDGILKTASVIGKSGAIIELKENLEERELLDYLIKLNQKENILFAGVCINDKSGNIMAANNQVLIGVKDIGEHQDEILAYLSKVNVESITQNKYDPKLYTLQIAKNEELNSIQVADIISKADFVKYVDPNFYLQMNR